MHHQSIDTFAAVDLGSNSFHMVIARQVAAELRILDRLRNQVQLADGLNHRNVLSEEAQDRALRCLEQFGERLANIPPQNVRAVGTNTLRRGKNARLFLSRAVSALGHYIEVISGPEEARLIYLGVAHSMPQVAGRRLVIDIGGGSTECIVGDGFEPIQAASMYMGCVSFSRAYFPAGKLTKKRMQRAETAARVELEAVERDFREHGWDVVAGSSGTIKAIEEVLRQTGTEADGITFQGLQQLRDQVIRAKHVDRLNLPGLKPERAPVLPGGLAILSALVGSLGVERIRSAQGALREGVLYDLLGRVRHEDIRNRTISRFVQTYHVDRGQAARVERCALDCFDQVAGMWAIDQGRLRQMLTWSAHLHEIGMVLSYAGYHKHGAYLIANSDMPGFSRDDQQLLAALIHAHRRKFPRGLFDDISLVEPRAGERLAILLRLAVLLNRGRDPNVVTPLSVEASDDALFVRLPDGWLDAHQLTLADFEEETMRLKKLKVQLTYQ